MQQILDFITNNLWIVIIFALWLLLLIVFLIKKASKKKAIKKKEQITQAIHTEEGRYSLEDAAHIFQIRKIRRDAAHPSVGIFLLQFRHRLVGAGFAGSGDDHRGAFP